MAVPARREEQQGKSLSDIFNQFAKESVEHFPAAKGKLLILDTNEYRSYGHESLNLKKADVTIDEINEFLDERYRDKSRQTYADWENEVNLYFIMYDEKVKRKERKNVPETTEKDIFFLLDHELAHIVIKDPALDGENTQYKDTLKEAIADAYAMIRHYQRFGADSEHKNSIIDPWARAGALTLNKDTIHFSTFMLEEIIKRKDAIDFKALSPQQTAELARRFAVQYTPPSSAVNRIFKKLKPVQDTFEKSPRTDKWLRKLAEITLDPANDPYTFKICNRILNGYLDGRKDMDGISVKVSGPYWDGVKKQLKEAEERHAREDILFNIPLMQDNKPKPQPPHFSL
jgi:DNA-binding transcriptional MerR regulator